MASKNCIIAIQQVDKKRNAAALNFEFARRTKKTNLIKKQKKKYKQLCTLRRIFSFSEKIKLFSDFKKLRASKRSEREKKEVKVWLALAAAAFSLFWLCSIVSNVPTYSCFRFLEKNRIKSQVYPLVIIF